MKSEFENKLNIILFKAIEGAIAPEELKQLQQMLKESKLAREYYLDFLEVHAGLNHVAGSCELDGQGTEFSIDYQILDELLNDSQLSPSVEIETQEEAIEKDLVRAEVLVPKPSRFFRIYSQLVSVAAVFLLIFVVYSNLFPPELYVPVATVNFQVDAEWERAVPVELKDGSILYTGPMSLKKGLAEIVLNNGAEVILEGPCEFTLESDSLLFLESGSIVANIDKVPDKRFVVRTETATVVDYGTEFGVNVDRNGNTSTQVFKGTVELRKGSDLLKYDKSLRLEKDQGGKVTTDGNVLSHNNTYAFVRKDQFEAEIKAAKGSAYYKWKAYSYQLRKRDDLLVYYTFENLEGEMLDNSAWVTKDKYQGKLMSSSSTGKLSGLVEGRWPEKQALEFDSKEQQYVLIDSDKALNISDNITLAVWVKLDTLEDGGHILSNRLEDSPVNYQLGYNQHHDGGANSKIQFVRYKVNIPENRKYSGTLPENDILGWHFITVTHDNKKIKFYLDAKLIDTVDYIYNGASSEGDLVMGTDRTTNEMFDGVLGELAVFNSVLDSSEIEEMYINGMP